ncbi:MAG: hypothetical protein ACKOW1_00700 [Novosphingobium sp.]|jgi:hypothetical protein
MPLNRTLAVIALAGLALSGCVASRYQISDALQRYGLSESQSSCAAEFLRGHLSTSQVSRLTKAARYYDRDGPLTFGDLVRVAGRVDDRDVLLQVGAAALACRIAADIPLPRF